MFLSEDGGRLLNHVGVNIVYLVCVYTHTHTHIYIYIYIPIGLYTLCKLLVFSNKYHIVLHGMNSIKITELFKKGCSVTCLKGRRTNSPAIA
jgi:hypothetical protein